MPVYEVRFLLEAESAEAGREAIRIPSRPHTEPQLSQWGYYSSIDEKTEGVYLSTLPAEKRNRQRQNAKLKEENLPRRVLSPEHKAKLLEGRLRAQSKRREAGVGTGVPVE